MLQYMIDSNPCYYLSLTTNDIAIQSSFARLMTSYEYHYAVEANSKGEIYRGRINML